MDLYKFYKSKYLFIEFVKKYESNMKNLLTLNISQFLLQINKSIQFFNVYFLWVVPFNILLYYFYTIKIG